MRACTCEDIFSNAWSLGTPRCRLAQAAAGAASAAAREARGLVPRCLEFLFDQIARETRRSNGSLSYSCKCSFFEIFNERVFDLLDSAGSAGAGDSGRRESDHGGGRAGSDRASRGSSSMMLPPEDLAGLTVVPPHTPGAQP